MDYKSFQESDKVFVIFKNMPLVPVVDDDGKMKMAPNICSGFTFEGYSHDGDIKLGFASADGYQLTFFTKPDNIMIAKMTEPVAVHEDNQSRLVKP